MVTDCVGILGYHRSSLPLHGLALHLRVHDRVEHQSIGLISLHSCVALVPVVGHRVGEYAASPVERGGSNRARGRVPTWRIRQNWG